MALIYNSRDLTAAAAEFKIALQAKVDSTYVDTMVSQEATARAAAVSNILANTDNAALDSLTEVVAAFQAADQTVNGAITELANSASATSAQALAVAQVAKATADAIDLTKYQTVESFNNTVANFAPLSYVDAQVGSKLDSSYLPNLQADISGLQTSVATKASATDVIVLANRVAAVESNTAANIDHLANIDATLDSLL